MSDDRELEDGLAAFDQLGRTMAETNHLLSRVQSSHTERTRQENALSAELQAALKQATEASQKALQASKAKLRSNPVVAGLQRPPDASDRLWRGILVWSSGRE